MRGFQSLVVDSIALLCWERVLDLALGRSQDGSRAPPG